MLITDFLVSPNSGSHVPRLICLLVQPLLAKKVTEQIHSSVQLAAILGTIYMKSELCIIENF